MKFFTALFLCSLQFQGIRGATYSDNACKPECTSGYKCVLASCVLDVVCKPVQKFGSGPPSDCQELQDPLNKTKSKLETWFTKDIFEDLFPKANIGWGPDKCFPFSYESFVIAARYFPNFGTEAPKNGYSEIENYKRDLSAFFSHAIQETGENDASLYQDTKDTKEADACFYRGGFFNWFEGGPTSMFLPPGKPGYQPSDGDQCISAGRYCVSTRENDYYYPCNVTQNGNLFYGCYLGRGALQISYNYNYGQFQKWLESQGLKVDLLNQPNLLMTKMNPPLAIMASLWFYMTPQPPKPAIHDIILGNWEPGQVNRDAGYSGPIFGPSSLVINNECNGEDPTTPGGPGENRRIKAFKWFCSYFNVPTGDDKTLTCKNMPQTLDQIPQNKSWEPDWSTTWKDQQCNCAPASYAGLLPYYQPGFYPDQYVLQNDDNRQQCVKIIYDNPSVYYMSSQTSACLNHVGP